MYCISTHAHLRRSKGGGEGQVIAAPWMVHVVGRLAPASPKSGASAGPHNQPTRGVTRIGGETVLSRPTGFSGNGIILPRLAAGYQTGRHSVTQPSPGPSALGVLMEQLPVPLHRETGQEWNVEQGQSGITPASKLNWLLAVGC